jgi:hypothetical protein
MRRVAFLTLIAFLPLFVLWSCSESPQGVSGTGSLQLAGNAHFVGTPQITTSGNDVTVSGKIAGLGNISQISVEVTGEAECLTRGNRKNPPASNKDDIAAGDTFPVQNGKANFSLTATADFSPTCSPPMSLEFSNLTIVVKDASGNVLLTFP